MPLTSTGRLLTLHLALAFPEWMLFSCQMIERLLAFTLAVMTGKVSSRDVYVVTFYHQVSRPPSLCAVMIVRRSYLNTEWKTTDLCRYCGVFESLRPIHGRDCRVKDTAKNG